MKQRTVEMLLMLAMGCRGDGRAIEAGMTPRDAAPGASPIRKVPAGSGPLTPLQIRLYERGREAEIAALRALLAEPVPHQALALDSIGAAAAGVRPESYRVLAARVDSALMRSGGETGSGTSLPPWEGRAGRLDSLRLERLVLVIRIKVPP